MLPEGVSKTIQNEAKEQRGEFLSILLGTLGASLLGNILTGKGAIAKSVSKETKLSRQRQGLNRAGEGIVRAGYWNKKGKKTRTKRYEHKSKMDF